MFILFGIGLLPRVPYRVKLLLVVLLGITVSIWLSSTYHGCKNGIAKISSGLISDDEIETHTHEVSKEGSVIHTLPYSRDDDEVELDVETAIHYSLSSVSMGGKDPMNMGMKGALYSEVKLRLHRNPVWDIDVEMGAASGNFDLTAYKVKTLSVEAGASSIQIKLGDLLNYSEIKIETGASSVNIMIPKSVSCRLEVESGLSGFEAQGFTKRGAFEYFSQGSVSGKDVFIKVEQGLSSLNIERY
ncbi:hypothetical protein CHS0354_000798 [Potamilus streckersoni]|uniref:DUF2154 domain-containing protein n=1 Tax=Potamilus streckersoni TaxID=2493646 RepID=A0AAE0W8L6_9BIVA|nr:hypothetical protein CHS0354_000798 [Potamilus streckersoni]